jgi:hypothetical protein
MIMDFIYRTPMLPKNDENHITCLVICEATIYLAFVDDITIEVYYLLFQPIAPFPKVQA